MKETTGPDASAHWAAQIVSAAGSSLLPAQPDFSHTNLGWSAEHEALLGQPLAEGRQAGLRLRDLSLFVTGSDARLSLPGSSVEAGLAWLSETLGASLTLPKHDMPAQPAVLGPGNPELASWFATADAQIEGVAEGRSVRCWPHHFDIATLLVIDEGKPAEEARSIGVGMTPGDGSYPEPYWYVTPWPYPDAATTLSPLPGHARWHTEGWTGAVLVGDRNPDVVHEFLSSAVSACRALLRP